jgi:hypothetical protein
VDAAVPPAQRDRGTGHVTLSAAVRHVIETSFRSILRPMVNPSSRKITERRARRAKAGQRLIAYVSLTHVYTKLGLTSRVQLAQEAARQG